MYNLDASMQPHNGCWWSACHGWLPAKVQCITARIVGKLRKTGFKEAPLNWTLDFKLIQQELIMNTLITWDTIIIINIVHILGNLADFLLYIQSFWACTKKQCQCNAAQVSLNSHIEMWFVKLYQPKHNHLILQPHDYN